MSSLHYPNLQTKYQQTVFKRLHKFVQVLQIHVTIQRIACDNDRYCSQIKLR
jgi:hypothetical protein